MGSFHLIAGVYHFLADARDEAPPYHARAAEEGYYYVWGGQYVWVAGFQQRSTPLTAPPTKKEERPRKKPRTTGRFSGAEGSERMKSVIEKVDSNSELNSPQPNTPFTSCQDGPSTTTTTSVGLIVEVGAGGGELSARLKGCLRNYEIIATDIADQEGERGWLLEAQRVGVKTMYGINANTLEQYFDKGSIDAIISMGCYGAGPKHPGESYGLAQCTGEFEEVRGRKKRQAKMRSGPRHNAPVTKPQTRLDDRFLRSAFGVLKPHGRVIILVRNNVLFDWTETLPGSFKNAAQSRLSEHNLKAASEGRAKLTTTNLYADISYDQLKELGEIGYSIEVTPTTPLEGVRSRAIDSSQDVELHGFNAQIVFTKTGTPSINCALKEQPFLGMFTPLEEDTEESESTKPYTILDPPSSTDDADSFFWVLAENVSMEMENVRVLLWLNLTEALFSPQQFNADMSDEDVHERLIDDILDKKTSPGEILTKETETAQLIQRLYQEQEGLPPSLAQYVVDLVWTSEEIALLKEEQGKNPGCPAAPIPGDLHFIPQIASRVFERPVILYAHHEQQLRRILDCSHMVKGEPIHIFYAGGHSFKSIEFNIAPRDVQDASAWGEKEVY